MTVLEQLPANPEPCGRCVRAWFDGAMRAEAIRPAPVRPFGALPVFESVPVFRTEACCSDCESADQMVKFGMVPDWRMARTTVGNYRQESMRLPGVPMGLGMMPLAKCAASEEGELEAVQDWLASRGMPAAARGSDYRGVGTATPLWPEE